MADKTQSFIPAMDVWLAALFCSGLLLVGAGIGFLVFHQLKKSSQARMEEEAEKRAARRLAEEERSQRISILEEKDYLYKSRVEQEKDLENQLLEIRMRESAVAAKDRDLTSRREDLRKEWVRLKTDQRKVAARDKGVREAAGELNQQRDQYRQRLEMAANMTADEAKEQLLETLAAEVKGSSAAMIRAERAKAREESEREARKIIAQAIQRCAVEEAEHFSTSTVALPNEGLKSRIIGKEGRNVRAFENATGSRSWSTILPIPS